jgi:mono/diheme cytochrome c family protein
VSESGGKGRAEFALLRRAALSVSGVRRLRRRVDNRAVALNARQLLASLVGATIHTVTGRPVTILDLRGHEVTVRTDSSPEGTSLPVEWVQDALDRLSSTAGVDIGVDSVGRRSSGLAAVLLTLAGGHDARLGQEDDAAAVRALPGNGRPLTVDPAVADRARRRRRHARRKVRRRAIAVAVVVALSAAIGAAIVASTTEGGPGGATEATPEAAARSTTKRGAGRAPDRTPDASARSMTKRGSGGRKAAAPEASATPATKRSRVRATEAARNERAKSTTERGRVGATEAARGAVADGAPDARAGKRVFTTVCGKCHTLTPGDWAHDKISLADLQPSYWTTREKVTNGGAAMPAFKAKLSEREIRNVAAFVARVAARKAARTGRAGR